MEEDDNKKKIMPKDAPKGIEDVNVEKVEQAVGD